MLAPGHEGNRFGNPVFIGKGAFARVFRVTEEATGRMFACKVCNDKSMAERERIFLKEIKHPLFPAYQGFFRTEASWCILMEYVCGCNLKAFVERRGVLSEEQAVRIVKALAEGLLYLHELPRTMIYRDLKPENVMIQADGKVRLIDVGCVAYAEDVEESGNCVMEEGADVAVLRRGTRAGTPGYAAPEQFREDAGIGRESDVYALGQLLQFMLSGKNVHKQGNFRFRCPKISSRMRKIINAATRQDPKRRVQDMRIFLQMLSGKKAAVDFYYEKNIRKGRTLLFDAQSCK